MVLLPGPPGREAWAALNPPIDAKMPVPGDASVKYVQGPRGPSKASTSIRVSKLTVTAGGGPGMMQKKRHHVDTPPRPPPRRRLPAAPRSQPPARYPSGRGAVALGANVGGDRLRRSEQHQCLVEQVCAEVEPDAGAGQRLFTPCARPQLGTEAIEVGFVHRHPAEGTLRQQCSQRDEVTHVPAVLVDRQYPALRGTELDKFVGFRHGGREWLVDHDVASGLETLLRDRMVRCVGCGDDDQIDGPGEQLIDAAHEFDSCITRVRRAPPMALDDGGEAETVDHANDGCVECLAGESETNEAHGEHG